MNTEAQNTAEFLAAVAKVPGLLVFRNNCRVLRDVDGRLLFFGVGGPSQQNRDGLGGSDFIGSHSITVTADMVGQKIAVFCAFELKPDAYKKTEHLARQENFLVQTNIRGGRAGFVRRGKDVTEILQGRGCVRLKDYQFTTYENT